MTDFRTMVRVIADVYNTEAAARTALINIGFPVTSIPAWDKAELFWSDVLQDLDRGRVQDGIALLVSGACEDFPANRRLQALMAEISVDGTLSRADQQGSPSASPSGRTPGHSGELTQLGPQEALGIGTGYREGGRVVGEGAVRVQKRARLAFGRRAHGAPQVSLRSLQGIEFQSVTRRLEPIGTEQIDFDNSGSSATSVETLRTSYSTRFVLEFHTERATLRDGQIGVRLLDFARAEGRLESSLRDRYALSHQSTLTAERTSQVTIPARAHVRVILNWKRVWQDGLLVLHTDGGDVYLPYSVTVDLMFDKTLTDIP
jgi:Effector-associated domain 1